VPSLRASFVRLGPKEGEDEEARNRNCHDGRLNESTAGSPSSPYRGGRISHVALTSLTAMSRWTVPTRLTARIYTGLTRDSGNAVGSTSDPGSKYLPRRAADLSEGSASGGHRRPTRTLRAGCGRHANPLRGQFAGANGPSRACVSARVQCDCHSVDFSHLYVGRRDSSMARKGRSYRTSTVGAHFVDHAHSESGRGRRAARTVQHRAIDSNAPNERDAGVVIDRGVDVGRSLTKTSPNLSVGARLVSAVESCFPLFRSNGSNKGSLVAGTGFEPATSGL